MRVHAVIGIQNGVIDDLEVYSLRESAERRGEQLAADYGFAIVSDRSNNPKGGPLGEWHRQWSDDERDLIVAELQIR